MNLYKLGLRNTLYNYAGLIVSAICSFLLIVVISRHLTVEEFGTYNLLFSFLAYISVLSSFGMPLVLKRYLPQFYEKGNYNAVKSFLAWGVIVRFLTSSIFIGLCLIFIEPLARLLNMQELARLFFFFSFAMLVVIQVKTIEVALEAMLLHNYTNIAKAVYAPLQLGLYFYVVKAGFGLKGIVLAYLCVNVFLLLAYLFIARKNIFTLPKNVKPQEIPFKKIIRFGIFSYFNDTTFIIFDFNTDFLIISFFLGSSFVGFYSFAATTISKLYAFLPISVAATVLFPILVRKYSRSEDKAELQYFFKLYNKAALFFSLPVAVGLYILADKIIGYVFHPQYMQVLAVFRFIVCAQLIYVFSTVLAYFVQILEKTQYTFYARIFVVYNIVMDIILIKSFGLMGVAFATASAWLFNALFVYVLVRRDIKLTYPMKSFLQITLNASLMGLAVYLLRGFVVDIWSLIAVIIVSIALYLLLNWLNRVFKGRDLEVFNKMLGVVVFK